MTMVNQKQIGWVRGRFLELDVNLFPEDTALKQSEIFTVIKQSIAAWNIIKQAQVRDLLPLEYQDWDDKGRGEGVSINLYAFAPLDCPRIVLVQVRRAYRWARKHYLNVKLKYFVTDGENVVKVPSYYIKRAAKLDPSPDSPLRAIKKKLPPEWQELVGEELRLPGPPQTGWRVVYKAMRLDDDGTLRSLFLPQMIYKVGKLYSEKARPRHGGGFYAYQRLEEAVQFARTWGPRYGAKRVAIVKCLARGGPIRYEAGKLAFSQLKPVEVMGVVEL